MVSAQLVRKAAWSSLAASLAVFIVGFWLLRAFLCQPYGPNAFAVSLFFCATAALFFAALAFQHRSIRIAGGAAAVALLGGIMFVTSVGLAISGCSGV